MKVAVATITSESESAICENHGVVAVRKPEEKKEMWRLNAKMSGGAVLAGEENGG
jgi:hypothetical protein